MVTEFVDKNFRRRKKNLSMCVFEIPSQANQVAANAERVFASLSIRRAACNGPCLFNGLNLFKSINSKIRRDNIEAFWKRKLLVNKEFQQHVWEKCKRDLTKGWFHAFVCI
jgi:hypothetical protein